jgi:hypothetical protein
MGLSFRPLAGDSLGVRSMATFVETPDVRILLDAGVSLGPRFRLLPHPAEYRVLKKARARLREAAQEAEVLTVSHYHFDHYTATWPRLEATWTWSHRGEAEALYQGKRLLVKDYRSKINFSQRQRGYLFHRIAAEFAGSIEVADAREFKIAGTTINTTEPLPHGEEDTQLGYVLAIHIKAQGESLLFAPDLQGPIAESSLKLLLSLRPDTLIIGGPPLYLEGFRIPKEAVARGIRHLEVLASKIPLILLDHHLLRDERGLDVVARVRAVADEAGNSVVTMAEYLGLQPQLLEARRRELYRSEPPGDAFLKWSRLSSEKRWGNPPPLPEG